MSHYKHEAREAQKSKMERMGLKKEHSPKTFSDTHTWDGEPGLDTVVPAGKQPVGKQHFKRGGKVLHAEGHEAHHHLGHKPRKAGGGLLSVNPVQRKKIVAALASRKKREGLPSAPPKPLKQGPSGLAGIGMMPHKRGGKVSKHPDEAEDRALVKKMVKPEARTGKADGGPTSDPNSYWYDAPKTAPDEQIIRALKNHGNDYKIINGKVHAFSPGDDKPVMIGNNVKKLREHLGYKQGGRAHKADGGPMDYSYTGAGTVTKDRMPSGGGGLGTPLPPRRPSDLGDTDTEKGNYDYGYTPRGTVTKEKHGGRIKRATGGRTKGKTNINIIVSPGHGDRGGMMPGAGVGMMPPPPPPAMPGAMPGGMPGGAGAPPMLPPAGAGPGLGAMGAMAPGRPGMSAPVPPMRKAGGRVKGGLPAHQEKAFGAGSGLGRLEKRKWPAADGTP